MPGLIILIEMKGKLYLWLSCSVFMLWARKNARGPSDAFFLLFMQFTTRLFVLRFGAVIKVWSKSSVAQDIITHLDLQVRVLEYGTVSCFTQLLWIPCSWSVFLVPMTHVMPICVLYKKWPVTWVSCSSALCFGTVEKAKLYLWIINILMWILSKDFSDLGVLGVRNFFFNEIKGFCAVYF